jgi:hypothetical protein
MLPQKEVWGRHRRHFESFAKEAGGDSLLYERLARALATDETAVRLLSHAPPSQRRANLLFAAVHDLLLDGVARRPTRSGAVRRSGPRCTRWRGGSTDGRWR